MLMKHAFYNIFRNKRRSLMIIVLLSLSTAIIYITLAYLGATYTGIRMGYQYQNGFIQLAARGYYDDSLDKKPILGKEIILSVEDYLSGNGEVSAYNYEIDFEGLIGTDMGSTVVAGVGVDTEKSSSGGAAGWGDIESGRSLLPGDIEELVIGRGVAAKIGANPGDWVVLMGRTDRGQMNLLNGLVTGITTSGNRDSDNYYAVAPLEFAQTVRSTEGIDRILIFLDRDRGDDKYVEALKSDLDNFIRNNNLAVDIRTWRELSPMYDDLKDMYDFIFLFLKIILMAMVFLSITELLSMTFFERFRELGTLRAMGNSKGEVAALLFMETIYYTLIGILAGLLLGYSSATVINALHLQWRPPGGTIEYPFSFLKKTEFLIQPALLITFSSLMAALIPAWKARNLEIIEALSYE